MKKLMAMLVALLMVFSMVGFASADEIGPVECRFVRLTMLDWPKNGPFSILDFSVFGKATGYSPSQTPIPTPKQM